MNKLSPKEIYASAVIVGYLLIDNLNSNEQNALGNWLMLTAQLLSTNAYFKEHEEEQEAENTTQQEIDLLTKMVNAMNQEINNLKSTI